MEVRFSIPGEPTGKGRPRTNVMYSEKGFVDKKTGKTRNTLVNEVTPQKTVNYEKLVKAVYADECDNYYFPDGSMLDLRIKAFYGIPKSKSKKDKERMRKRLLRPTKKPDMDNVVKIIADALNKIAYKDDTQIVDCQCRKFYADDPRVEVSIKTVEPEAAERSSND
jgi:Holliday junction resolvase RusA-like endonuclease